MIFTGKDYEKLTLVNLSVMIWRVPSLGMQSARSGCYIPIHSSPKEKPWLVASFLDSSGSQSWPGFHFFDFVKPLNWGKVLPGAHPCHLSLSLSSLSLSLSSLSLSLSLSSSPGGGSRRCGSRSTCRCIEWHHKIDRSTDDRATLQITQNEHGALQARRASRLVRSVTKHKRRHVCHGGHLTPVTLTHSFTQFYHPLFMLSLRGVYFFSIESRIVKKSMQYWPRNSAWTVCGEMTRSLSCVWEKNVKDGRCAHTP